jgi:hypothetical protein
MVDRVSEDDELADFLIWLDEVKGDGYDWP